MVLVDPKDPSTRRQLPELRGAGSALGIQMVEHGVTTQTDIERALGATDRSKVDGVFVLSRTHGTNFPSLILRLSTAKSLPLVGSRKEWVEQGALFSYAPDLAAIGRQAAPYVTRILTGIRPGDLPVQEPTKFELVINRKVARALGLTIPQPLMLQADQVID